MNASRINATVQAAETLITNMLGVLSGLNYTNNQLNLACSSFLALDWSPSVASIIGMGRLTRLFTRLKISRLSKHDYRALLRTMMVASPDVSAISPFPMEDRRRVIVRFELSQALPFHDWLTIIHDLENHLIETPSQLAEFSFNVISGFSERCANPGLAMRLWQATCISHGSEQRIPCALPLETNAKFLAQSVRASTLNDTGFARSHKRALEGLGVPASFDKAGPAAKARMLAEGDNAHTAAQAFLSSGASVNVLRQAQYSTGSIASGIQCWIAFCDLQGHPYFPPTSSRVCAWGSLFQPGGTYAQYVAHLSKGCQLLDIPTGWHDSSVAAVSRGLRKAQNLSFMFSNYLFRPDLIRFLDYETLESEFGMLGFFSFLFLLRVQSEGLPMRRATLQGDILQRVPQKHQALIGLRGVAGDQRLVLKLNTRKNTRYGSIIMRPCFCEGGILVHGPLSGSCGLAHHSGSCLTGRSPFPIVTTNQFKPGSQNDIGKDRV